MTALASSGSSAYSPSANITGTSYTLSDADNNKLLPFTSASAVTVTVPSGLSNINVVLAQMGAGIVTLSGSGATINGVVATVGQYSTLALLNTAADTYLAQGADSDIAAIAALTGNGAIERTAANTWSMFSLTGVVVPFAGTTAPTGWLLCYGQAVSRTTYANLFGVISTSFGVGDGSTTFNVPDLRGRAVIGLDNLGGSSANRVTAAAADSLGGAAGAETHTLSATEMPSHTHALTGTYVTTSAGLLIATGTGAQNINTSTNPATTSAGSGGAHNNMQPYMALGYIIKT